MYRAGTPKMLTEWNKCQENKSSVWFPKGGKGKSFTIVLIGTYDEFKASKDSYTTMTNKRQEDLDTHNAHRAN